MKYDKRIGILILTVLVIVLIINPLRITSLTISDTDPTTYVIVPLMMLPLLTLFMAKNDLKINVRRRDIAIGIALFALLVALEVYLRATLSYLFLTYGIEMLIFPLGIASLIILLFGLSNINRFKVLLVYCILASPIILMSITGLNSWFSTANSVLIYHVSQLFSHSISYIPPITMTANGNTIAIGNSCVGVAAIIALVLFLVPVAYLYDGKLKRKALWIAAGFILILFLNVLRMLFIALEWLLSGPSNAILTIHLFAGVLLFYASIIIMVLLAGRFGLTFPKPRKRTLKERPATSSGLNILVAVILALIWFLLTIDYSSSYLLSSNLVSHSPFNASAGPIDSFINSTLHVQNSTDIVVISNNGTLTGISITNSTILSSEPLAAILSYRPIDLSKGYYPNNTVIRGSYSFMDRGSTSTMSYITVNDSGFFIYHAISPYGLYNDTVSNPTLYMVLPEYLLRNESCSYDTGASYLMNAQHIFENRTTVSQLKKAYCTVSAMVGQ